MKSIISKIKQFDKRFKASRFGAVVIAIWLLVTFFFDIDEISGKIFGLSFFDNKNDMAQVDSVRSMIFELERMNTSLANRLQKQSGEILDLKKEFEKFRKLQVQNISRVLHTIKRILSSSGDGLNGVLHEVINRFLTQERQGQ